MNWSCSLYWRAYVIYGCVLVIIHWSSTQREIGEIAGLILFLFVSFLCSLLMEFFSLKSFLGMYYLSFWWVIFYLSLLSKPSFQSSRLSLCSCVTLQDFTTLLKYIPHKADVPPIYLLIKHQHQVDQNISQGAHTWC